MAAAYRARKAVFMTEVMLALIPVMLITLISFEIIGMQATEFQNIKERDIVQKLFRVSDLVVKDRAVLSDGIRVVNWFDDNSVDFDTAQVATMMGLKEIYVGFAKGPDSGTCIYRIVAYGPEKEIKKLFVCGK